MKLLTPQENTTLQSVGRCTLTTRVDKLSINDMQINFAEVVGNTIDALESSQVVTTDKFARSLLFLQAYEPALKKEQAFLEDHKKELYSAKSFSEICDIILPYMSFFNPGLLKYIIKRHGTQENKVDFKKYKRKLRKFCEDIAVFPLPANFSSEKQSPSSEKREEIKIKLNLNDRRLQLLCDVKSAIAKILKVNEVSLYFKSAKKGCIEVVFLVPRFMVDYLFPLAEEQLKAISSLGALKLTTSQGHHYEFDVSINSILM